MNKVILAGRLTQDPELKTTNTGIEVVSFSVAVNRNYKKDDGTQEADFINCQAWRQKAVFLNKYFSKGDGVVLEGKLQTRTYKDKNGNNRTAVEVVVDELEFPQGRTNKSNGTNNDNCSTTQLQNISQDDEELIPDDDLPF